MKKSIVLIVTAFVGCAGLKLADPLRIDDRDWAQFGKTSSRINCTNEVVAPPLALAWEYDISSGMGYGSPVVIDSIVIVTNMRGELYGINARTGKRIGWITLGDAVNGSPVVDRNVAYVASSNTRESLAAYDLEEGRIIWKQEYGDIEASPLLFNNFLYVGNTAGIFFCVEREKGELQWKFRLSENTKRKGIRTTATATDSLIIFGAEDGSIYALDARYGTERWSYDTGSPIFASPAINNGVVYCGSNNGFLYAINAKSGALVWKFNAGASIYATPSFTNNLVLIGTTGGKLYALNANDGSTKWTTEFNSVINSSAVISGNVAYVGTLKKEFAAVNIDNGAIVWTTKLEGRIKTSPAIANGKVFVATDDKMILAFKSTETK
jgi:outer membrane protein assembly factor BamB